MTDIRLAEPPDVELAAALLDQTGFRGWGPAALAAAIDAPDQGLWVASVVRGVALVRWVLDEAELLAIAVTPEHRRQGYARALLATVLTSLQTQGIRVLHLEVRARNRAARDFYAMSGFQCTGRRPGFYGDDDAVLMARTVGD